MPGVATVTVPTKGRDLSEVGGEMLGLLEAHAVDVILLAGYLKLVPPRRGGTLSTPHPEHPSRAAAGLRREGMYGMNVHRAVLEADVSESGATVHFVDEKYDEGLVLAQRRVQVLGGDTPDDLAARVLEVEHQLYPEAVDHLCDALAAGRTRAPRSSGAHRRSLKTRQRKELQ